MRNNHNTCMTTPVMLCKHITTIAGQHCSVVYREPQPMVCCVSMLNRKHDVKPVMPLTQGVQLQQASLKYIMYFFVPTVGVNNFNDQFDGWTFLTVAKSSETVSCNPNGHMQYTGSFQCLNSWGKNHLHQKLWGYSLLYLNLRRLDICSSRSIRFRSCSAMQHSSFKKKQIGLIISFVVLIQLTMNFQEYISTFFSAPVFFMLT